MATNFFFTLPDMLHRDLIIDSIQINSAENRFLAASDVSGAKNREARRLPGETTRTRIGDQSMVNSMRSAVAIRVAIRREESDFRAMRTAAEQINTSHYL